MKIKKQKYTINSINKRIIKLDDKIEYLIENMSLTQKDLNRLFLLMDRTSSNTNWDLLSKEIEELIIMLKSGVRIKI